MFSSQSPQGFTSPQSAGLSAARSRVSSSFQGSERAAESPILDLFSHAHFQNSARQLDLFGSYVIPELHPPQGNPPC